MDSFAPELSKMWLGEVAGTRADAGRGADEDPTQQDALQTLADLVSAARTIV
jgi:hypothetical protein